MGHRNPFRAIRPAESVLAAAWDLCVLQARVAGASRAWSERRDVASYAPLESLLRSIDRRLTEHAGVLRGAIEDVEAESGASPAVERAGEVVLPQLPGASVARRFPVSELVRHEAALLGCVQSGLTLLHSLAVARSVDLLEQPSHRQLVATTSLLVELNLLLPAIVIHESSRREPVAAASDASDRATRQVRAAWRPRLVR